MAENEAAATTSACGARPMTVNDGLRLMAGTFVLIGLVLGYVVNPWWHLLVVFVALNQIQSAFTKWCPGMVILRRLGLRD